MLQSSLDRPAWTSEQETGMFRAYRHKHTVLRGRFVLVKDYYHKVKGRPANGGDYVGIGCGNIARAILYGLTYIGDCIKKDTHQEQTKQERKAGDR